jgi:AcrR family transcriptional regulator
VTKRRGPYAKSSAKRAEILRVALEAYASSGRQGPSLRSIAEAVGLSEAGVLHHFSSKDELLVAVLEARDEKAREAYDLTDPEQVFALLGDSTKTPGLVKLFVDMGAASADPDHPAAAFMRAHTARATEVIANLLGPGSQREARLVVAAADGLNVQWLRDPSIDIAGELELLYREVRAARVT